MPQAVLDAVTRAEPDPGGHRHPAIPVGSVTHAESELLRLGPEEEVLAPAELRERVGASTRAMAALYV